MERSVGRCDLVVDTHSFAADKARHHAGCTAASRSVRAGQSGEHEHHSGRGAEVRFGDAALDETYGAVKPQRVRIGGDLQRSAPSARRISAMRLRSAAAIPRASCRPGLRTCLPALRCQRPGPRWRSRQPSRPVRRHVCGPRLALLAPGSGIPDEQAGCPGRPAFDSEARR
jgi:hypothetical protein